jgi:transposase-like protein
MPGPKAILDEPKTRKRALSMLAKGATKTEVARKVGCVRSTVSTWSNREEVQHWIEDETQKYLDSLPDALAISKNLLQAGKEESGKLLGKDGAGVDFKTLEMATREAESMRKSVGIIPAQHQSVLIANIYNDNRNQVVLPAVQSLLDKLCAIDITSPEDGPETANPMRTEANAGEEP